MVEFLNDILISILSCYSPSKYKTNNGSALDWINFSLNNSKSWADLMNKKKFENNLIVIAAL